MVEKRGEDPSENVYKEWAWTRVWIGGREHDDW